VARVLIDGTLDPTFGQGGVAAATVVGSVGRFAGVDVLAQGDHKVVVVGFATGLPALTQDFAVVRLDADGTLDQDFGTAGSAVVDFGRNEYPVAASIQGDGAIVVAGRSISYLQVSNGASPSDIALARLHGITTPDAVIEELVPVVQDYVDQGLLSHTASKSLQSKLEAALQQVENGNMQPAVKQLEAFIHQVGALVNSGHLSAGDGAHLADGAIDARTLILNG